MTATAQLNPVSSGGGSARRSKVQRLRASNGFDLVAVAVARGASSASGTACRIGDQHLNGMDASGVEVIVLCTSAAAG